LGPHSRRCVGNNNERHGGLSMKKNLKTKVRALAAAATLGFTVLAGASVPANAILLNFLDYIDGVGERAVTGTFNLGGLTITAFGSNNTVGSADFVNGPFAYLDGPLSGDRAGIGVCQNITGALQCNPPSDDNVTVNGSNNEILSLSFDKEVRVDAALFRNNGHTATFGGDRSIDVSVGAGGFSTETLVDGLAPGLLGAGLVGSPSFLLAIGDTINFKFNNQQFYLSALDVRIDPGKISVVPLPASFYLFGTGLLGIGFLARRRRKKTQAGQKFA